ncbi:MAG: hypothetical protein EPN21_12185 [Methylococcaceae bacterium]|nr:MAG: hypothetical protein EPN21_12185 [Methylococcaceae bacterium]
MNIRFLVVRIAIQNCYAFLREDDTFHTENDYRNHMRNLQKYIDNDFASKAEEQEINRLIRILQVRYDEQVMQDYLVDYAA